MGKNDLQPAGNTLPQSVIDQMAAAVTADLSRLGNVGNEVIRVTQDKKFVFPDETVTDTLNAVIVDFVYRNEYYVTPYKPNQIVAPTCFAVGDTQSALAPVANSPKRQVPEGQYCKDCQWDKFGTGQGGTGKACKNAVYMAVLQPDATEDSPLFVLKTSPTGITPFNQYVLKVSRRVNLPVWGVHTLITFDPAVTYASLRFELVKNNPVLDETMKRRDEARRRLMQEPDFSSAIIA